MKSVNVGLDRGDMEGLLQTIRAQLRADREELVSGLRLHHFPDDGLEEREYKGKPISDMSGTQLLDAIAEVAAHHAGMLKAIATASRDVALARQRAASGSSFVALGALVLAIFVFILSLKANGLF